MRKGEIWEKQGSPGKGLIFLLVFLSPGLGSLTRLFCGLLCPLDAAGMCGWVEELLAWVMVHPRSQNMGLVPFAPALPGSPDTVRGTGPSIEGPQLSEEKSCTALRCGPRGL